MEASQPAYRAGPVGETVLSCVHMEKFQPACRDRNLTCVKNETRAHCLETQRMSNSDIFVSVAGMECSYGKISSHLPRSRHYTSEVSLSGPARLLI